MPIPPTQDSRTGIFDDLSGPLSRLFRPGNHWQGYVNGEWLRVFAGVHVDDSTSPPYKETGSIYVIVRSQDLLSYRESEYELSDVLGGLEIEAETNQRLTLLSVDGDIYYFDVPTRQYVDSASEEVNEPTATAIPPATSPVLAVTPPAYVGPQDSATDGAGYP